MGTRQCSCSPRLQVHPLRYSSTAEPWTTRPHRPLLMATKCSIRLTVSNFICVKEHCAVGYLLWCWRPADRRIYVGAARPESSSSLLRAASSSAACLPFPTVVSPPLLSSSIQVSSTRYWRLGRSISRTQNTYATFPDLKSALLHEISG